MRLVKILAATMLIATLSLNLPAIALANGSGPAVSADIVYIVDVSGSMDQTDSERFARDALNLGVDLAPENSRVAIVAVNYRVVSEAGLTDVSTSEGREYLKGYINRLQNQGNTNFVPGFERALEILNASNANQKRVIFLGDFIEGGYNAGTRNQEAEAAAMIDDIAARARSSGVAIDMILWDTGRMPPDSITGPRFFALPGTAGGTLFELPNPNRAPVSIENIYFQNFEYRYIVLSVRGGALQSFHKPMPTANVRRARVYVSAQFPVSAFGASYAGANLDGSQNRSYAMVDLANPSPSGINLTINPGASGVATIYMLLEYGPLELVVSAEREAEVFTIHAKIVDAETGAPLLTAPYPANAAYIVEITSPVGQVPFTYDPAAPASFSFSPGLPEEFGMHQVTATLTVGNLVFGPFEGTVDLPDTRPPLAPPLNWPLIIAIAIGCILILAALLIALKIRKKEVGFQGAAEMASDYKFHGKLSVYAVMLEGGDRELRPFNFALHTIEEKKITLRNILDSVGAKDIYAGAEDILFLVGPEESIVVRNNSKAAIKVMGRNYEYRSKTQLFYGQKMYIVFEKDENELEINYRKAKNDDSRPVVLNIQSRRVHT